MPLKPYNGPKRDTADSLEIERIVRLPIVGEPSPEEVECISREVLDASVFDSGQRLYHTQAGGLLAWQRYEGLFGGGIGVGWGKTGITLLVADDGFKRGVTKRSLLLVPSQVYGQLTRTDIATWRRWANLRVPVFLFGDKSSEERVPLAKSGKTGLYIMPYSLLSARDASVVLDALKPDLIIMDEAHNVKNPRAARTKRIITHLRQYQPKVVVLSGTITSKSINDYAHLISAALRENSPLPMEPQISAGWAQVLDSGADPSDAQTGPIMPLLDWSRKHFPGEKIPHGVPGFRKAYKLRLETAPGVVSTGDKEIGTSLTISNRPVPKGYEESEGFKEVARLVKQLDELWISPSGDEIEYGIHLFKYRYELASGFYHRLRWPSVEELCAKGLLAHEAELYLEGALEHHAARQAYSKALRWWLEHSSQPGLDTPFLVGGDMSRHGSKNVGSSLYADWKAMKDLEFYGMPERVSEPVRLCSFKIDHTVEWAKEVVEGGEGALIWFHHNDVGRWLTEALEAARLPVLYCPADSLRPGANSWIVDPANAKRLVVASMSGHGTGKNLQHFQRQMFVQFPRVAQTLEQVLGRTHRNGQQADELLAECMNTLEADHLVVAACLIDSLYIHQTSTRMKAIVASYDPLPRIYPEDFLRERGFVDVARLDTSTRQALENKFGPLDSSKKGR